MTLDDVIVITKSVNNGFICTNLKEVIDSKDCEILFKVGLTTDHCVSTTRMAGNTCMVHISSLMPLPHLIKLELMGNNSVQN